MDFRDAARFGSLGALLPQALQKLLQPIAQSSHGAPPYSMGMRTTRAAANTSSSKYARFAVVMNV